MKLGIDRKDLLGVAAVFLLAMGVWSLFSPTTPAGYADASGIRTAVVSGSGPAHYLAAAHLLKLLSPAASSPEAIVALLLVFSPLLLAVSSVFAYLALRALDFERKVSAFSAILFASSLSSLAFLPGVYGAAQLALLPFSLSLFFLARLHAKKGALSAVAAALFGAAAGYVFPPFGLSCAAVAIAFGAADYSKHGLGQAGLFALPLVAGLASALAAPGSQTLFFSLPSLLSVLQLSPFLLACAACAAVMATLNAARMEHALAAVAGLAMFGVSPQAGAMLLMFPAAEGISSLASEKSPKRSKLAGSFALAALAVVGIAYPLSGLQGALVAGALVGLLLPLVFHLYSYRQALASACAIFLFCLSIFGAIFYSLPPAKPAYPLYSDAGVASALDDLSDQPFTGTLYMLSSQDAARFYLPSVKFGEQRELAAYLGSGQGKLEPGALLLLSQSDIDSSSELFSDGSFETFAFIQNASVNGRPTAVFLSKSGSLLLRQISDDGSLALADATLADQYGRPYATVPLSRMVLLDSSINHHEAANRVVLVSEDASVPHLVDIYSGRDASVSLERSYATIRIYKVK